MRRWNGRAARKPARLVVCWRQGFKLKGFLLLRLSRQHRLYVKIIHSFGSRLGAPQRRDCVPKHPFDCAQANIIAKRHQLLIWLGDCVFRHEYVPVLTPIQIMLL